MRPYKLLYLYASIGITLEGCYLHGQEMHLSDYVSFDKAILCSFAFARTRPTAINVFTVCVY